MENNKSSFVGSIPELGIALVIAGLVIAFATHIIPV